MLLHINKTLFTVFLCHFERFSNICATKFGLVIAVLHKIFFVFQQCVITVQSCCDVIVAVSCIECLSCLQRFVNDTECIFCCLVFIE